MWVGAAVLAAGALLAAALPFSTRESARAHAEAESRAPQPIGAAA
jgi:hypothetical protein